MTAILAIIARHPLTAALSVLLAVTAGYAAVQHLEAVSRGDRLAAAQVRVSSLEAALSQSEASVKACTGQIDAQNAAIERLRAAAEGAATQARVAAENAAARTPAPPASHKAADLTSWLSGLRSSP